MKFLPNYGKNQITSQTENLVLSQARSVAHRAILSTVPFTQYGIFYSTLWISFFSVFKRSLLSF